jgi:hypothetical protein
MSRRRPQIQQRKVIFVGCEGESERGYGGLLQDLADARGLRVHIQAENLHPAGDPLARVERALKRLEHISKTRGAIRDRFILLDTDQVVLHPQRAQLARSLAAHHGIILVWQDPAVEGVLLRDLAGMTDRRPPDAPSALQALESAWPGYAKAMSRADLAARIDLEGVLRAAAVEPELRQLLQCIGLMA